MTEDVAGVGTVRDLASGNPDPALLPALRPALDAAEVGQPTVDNVRSVLPELGELAYARFTGDRVPVREVAACAGALDAMERVLTAHVRPGARVLVEDPGYPPVFYLLAALGLKAVAHPVDSCGLALDGFAEAVRGVDALVTTPRAQNPTGAVTTPERAAALSEVLDGHPDVLVIEDDHAGDIAGAEVTTLAHGERRSWAVIRSVSKSLGADLRLAMVAADRTTMATLRGRQRRGPGWVSGLLQQVVRHQWTAPDALETLHRAKAAYAERRCALVEALAARGIAATGRSGLNVWVPVDDEDLVVSRVRGAGYAIAAGRKFRRNTGPAVRVTISQLPTGEADAVAGAVAAAVADQPTHRPRRAAAGRGRTHRPAPALDEERL